MGGSRVIIPTHLNSPLPFSCPTSSLEHILARPPIVMVSECLCERPWLLWLLRRIGQRTRCHWSRSSTRCLQSYIVQRIENIRLRNVILGHHKHRNISTFIRVLYNHWTSGVSIERLRARAASKVGHHITRTQSRRRQWLLWSILEQRSESGAISAASESRRWCIGNGIQQRRA